MSRLAGFLLVVLGATAFADTPEPPASSPKSEESAAAKSSKFPLRVVKVMMDSEQALLFDKNRGRHVLVELGEVVGDYTVTGLDEEEVTLTGKDLPVEVVLAAPASKAAAKQARKAKKAEKAAAAAADAAAAAEIEAADAAEAEAAEEAEIADAGDAAPEDPYDKPAPKKPLADPYADDESPEDETADEFSSAITADDTEDRPKPKKPSANATAKLSKAEVVRALNDFGVLAKSIDGSFTKTGLLLEKVAPGSVFAKAGLTVGDVVMGIDGRPLRTIDDAADLYARAASMKNANVQIIRSGKPQTLRVLIQ